MMAGATRFVTRSCAFWIAVVLLGLFLRGNAAAGASEDSLDGGWRFSLTPYVWVPSIDGTLHFTALPGTGPEYVVTIEPVDYFDNLDVPLMVAASASRGPWTLVTDFFWVDLSGERGTVKSITSPGGIVEVPVDAGSVLGLNGTIWTLGGGRVAFQEKAVTLAILAGFRYFAVKTSLDWRLSAGTLLGPQSGSLSQSDDLWDGIVGVRGEVRLGQGRWRVPFDLDGGVGSSTTTWSATAGVGYAFGWGDLRLLYRHVQWNAMETTAIQSLRLGGPAFGTSFRF